jgi:hypothetical protein
VELGSRRGQRQERANGWKPLSTHLSHLQARSTPWHIPTAPTPPSSKCTCGPGSAIRGSAYTCTGASIIISLKTPAKRDERTSTTCTQSTPASTTSSCRSSLWSCPARMSGLPKRIIKESERLVKEPVQGISATPHDDNLRYFDVTIDGPSQSPYEGESGETRATGVPAVLT